MRCGTRHLILILPAFLVHCGDQTPQRQRAVTDGAVMASDGGQLNNAPAEPPGNNSGSSDSGGSCQHGTYFNGYCYFTAGLGEMDYESAKALCKALGAEPATIHSEAENKLIYGLLFHISSGGWIGLTRDADDFEWEDGSTLAYSNWAPDEPDYGDCAVIVGPYEDQARQGKWEASPCDADQDEIVCKRKP